MYSQTILTICKVLHQQTMQCLRHVVRLATSQQLCEQVQQIARMTVHHCIFLICSIYAGNYNNQILDVRIPLASLYPGRAVYARFCVNLAILIIAGSTPLVDNTHKHLPEILEFIFLTTKPWSSRWLQLPE